MVRVHLVVEGQTEETFVRKVLAPYLGSCRVFVDARSVETSRHHSKVYRGGVLDYGRVRRDLERWMRQDDHGDCHFSTMVDLYHLPEDFPRLEEARKQQNPYDRIKILEDGFRQDIDHPRFIPYIQLHEFEALLLCDPNAFDTEFNEHRAAIDNLVRMAQEFESPELINDGQETAPSKRIIKEIPDYLGRKVSSGPLIAERISLPALRAKCQHFNEWLHQLEELEGAER
ncbi:MAG TPA: DUF4276 family protein [Chloroflexota bacterium]|nr:DUF4276 family protein [Chloroflexota bacterium]